MYELTILALRRAIARSEEMMKGGPTGGFLIFFFFHNAYADLGSMTRLALAGRGLLG